MGRLDATSRAVTRATEGGRCRHPRTGPGAAFLAAVCWGALALPMAEAAAAASCEAQSAALQGRVVELYTSEGCSSCPPADRWLTQRAAAGDVTLAWHVDYWDHLGWRDRWSSAAAGARQGEQLRFNGARLRYTPQVVVNGVSQLHWRAGTLPAAHKPVVRVTLRRETGGDYVGSVSPLSAAPERLSALWALTEDGHKSVVRAGENAGTTLHHSAVVREWHTVPGWLVAAGERNSTTLRWRPGVAADPAHPQHVSLVVLDAQTGRPLEALKLRC